MRLHAAPPARGLVPTLTLATFVNHLNVIAWNPFLPFIAAELGVAAALLIGLARRPVPEGPMPAA